MTIKTFAISLESAADRRAHLVEGLSKFNIDFELFPAVLGSAVDRSSAEIYDEDQYEIRNNCFSKTTIKGKLNDGELGCALSHLRVYQKILDAGLPGAIVLEDDFIAYNNFPQVFAAILEQIPQADIINAFATRRKGLRNFWFRRERQVTMDCKNFTFFRAGIPGLDWLLNRRRRVDSCRCYYISSRACRRLIDLGYPVRMEADRLTGMAAYNKLKIYMVEPFLSSDGNFASIIESTGARKQKAV